MEKTKINLERLNQIPIEKVATRLGLKLDGYKSFCFEFHHLSPTVALNKQRNSWYCFECKLGGNVIEFVEMTKKCSTEKAAQWLAKEFDKKYKTPIK